MPDFCDFAHALRTTFFPRDRDVALQPNRNFQLGSGGDFYLSSTSNIYWPGNIPATMPDGNIVLMFSGAIGNIPTGWQLADGTNGTTDLRGMFVVGAGGSYSVGDTGGADTVDISHIHADTFSVNSDSHSHNDTFSVNSDSHSHNSGTLSTDSDGHNHTMPGASVTIGNEAAHTHGDGSYSAAAPSAGTGHIVPWGADTTLISKATFDAHTHNITGTSAGGSSHSHSITGTTATHNHSHDVNSGSTASDSHSHNLSGSVSSDSHSHTLSGSVSTGGDTTHDNRPAYYALCFIMRPT